MRILETIENDWRDSTGEIDSARVTWLIERIKILETSLKKATEMITSEYCGHGASMGAKERNEYKCGPSNKACYGQPFYKLIDAG